MKVLWIGDAACGSGFGRATHHILIEMMKQDIEVISLGVNYRGDPHNEPFKIFPAWLGGDQIGIGRVDELISAFEPTLVVMQTNPWNVPRYLKPIARRVPTVGIVAIEGRNCIGTDLNGLHHAIFWNRFGQREAEWGGYTGTSGVVPLGVDPTVFMPGDALTARKYLFPKNPELWESFIVLNVNRNQNRKKLDLTIKYFADWWNQEGRPDAYLYLHVLPGSVRSCDCAQLSRYYGLKGRVVVAEPHDIFHGAPEHALVATYQAADVFLTTTLGEGHGLTPMEAAACHKPVIAGDYAALGEWGQGALYLVPVEGESVMPDVNNMLGAAPKQDAVVDALHLLYCNPVARAEWADRGYHRVLESQFSWASIGQRYVEEIQRGAAVKGFVGPVR